LTASKMPKHNAHYSNRYYETIGTGSLASAREVLPIILEFVQPRSVIDVGCGVGTWLSVFRECGIDDYLGVDGDYVDRKMLMIPEDCFIPHDLTVPFRIERKFDLAISMEVAEHLPPESAKGFVESLVRLAPVILFSAAVPYQGGTDHLNEQWPEYWAELFRQHEYAPIDCVRARVWRNEAVDWWYAQNAFVYVKRNQLDTSAVLRAELERTPVPILSAVHPTNYIHYVNASNPRNMPLSKIVSALPVVAGKSLIRRMTRLTK
jgi:SAM-dependent methyltransferase